MSLGTGEIGKVITAFLCFLITIILINGAFIAAQEGAEKKHREFSDADLLKEMSYLLRQRLDEYARLCEDEADGKPVREKMIPLLENIVGLFKHLRNIHEARGGDKQRIEKINRLIEAYEKKKLHYLKSP